MVGLHEDMVTELQAQLESHPKAPIRVVNEDGMRVDITNVSYDGEYDTIVIEVEAA